MNNIWKQGWFPFRRPFDNIKHFFRNIKYSYQRITKGYCDSDVWNLNYYLLNLFSDSISELAEISHGWPGNDKYPTFEDWQTALRQTAQKFTSAASIETIWEENPYYEEYSNISRNYIFKENKDGSRVGFFSYKDPKDEELVKKYLEAEINHENELYHQAEEGLDWIKNNFWSLWD